MKVIKETKHQKELRERRSVVVVIGHFFKKLFSLIGQIFLYLFEFIKSLFILLEKALKVVALFIVTIAGAVLFLSASFYLVYNTIGLKESPSFQELRETVIMSQKDEVEQAILEHELRWYENLENENLENEPSVDLGVDI